MPLTSKEHSLLSWRRSLTTGLWRLLGMRSWISLPRNFCKAATQQNLRYCLKVGIAAVLAYMWALWADMHFSIWAPMSAIIVMQVHVSASLEISLMRLVGTSAGAALGLGAALLLPDTLWGLAAGLLLVTSLSAFLELWEQRFRMAGMTAVLVLLLGRTVDVGAGTFAVDRVLEMGMGIVSALVVSALLWPASATSQIQAAVRGQLQEASEVLAKMTEAFLNRQQSVSPRLLDHLLNSISANTQEFERVRNYELYHIHREYPHLGACMRLMDEMRTYLAAMLDALNNDAGPGVELEMTQELRELSGATVQGLRWLAKREKDMPQDLQPTIDAGTVRFAVVRTQGLFRNYDDAKVMQIFAFYNALCHVAQAVSLMQERLGQERLGQEHLEQGAV